MKPPERTIHAAVPPMPAPPGPASEPGPASALAVGERVNGCVVLKKLGEGAMGEVWLVRHEMLNQLRAMKVVKRDAITVGRFREEMQGLAAIKHDNVVKVLDSGVLPNGSLYYAMEFVKGSNLEVEIHKHAGQRPQWEFIREIMLQICDGLSAIHGNGFIHRDIKPANCMLDMDSDPVRVKIVDLGVAKKRTSIASESSTSEGMFIGTPRYSSPEQASGAQDNLTYSSDIYSVGLIFYELLTGQVPHALPEEADDWDALLLRRYRAELPPPPSRLAPPDAFPAEVDEIVARALQPDPRDRFQSIQEMALAIRELGGSESAEMRALWRSPRSPSRPDVPQPRRASAAHPVASGAGLHELERPRTERPQGSEPELERPAGVDPPRRVTAPQTAIHRPEPAPVRRPGSAASTRAGSWRPLAIGGISAALALAVTLAVPRLWTGAPPTEADPVVSAEVEEAPTQELELARRAIKNLGLRESRKVAASLHRFIDDPSHSPAASAPVKLALIELMLMQALSCRIAVSIEPSAMGGRAQALLRDDLPLAAALLEGVAADSEADAEQVRRLQALRALVEGKPVGRLPPHSEELELLVASEPLWRGGVQTPPPGLMTSLQRLSGSTVSEAVLALAVWRIGDPEGARAQLRQIVERAGDHAAARAMLEAIDRVDLLTASGEPMPPSDPEPDARKPKRGPRPPVADKPPEEAPVEAEPEAETEPSEHVEEWRISTGCRKVRQGDPAGVLLLLDAVAAGADPAQNLNLCLCLGAGFARQNSHDTALVWYRRALTQSPDNRDAVAGAARSADLLGRTAAAVDYYRKLRALEPDNTAAAAYLAKHDDEAAEAAEPGASGELMPIKRKPGR